MKKVFLFFLILSFYKKDVYSQNLENNNISERFKTFIDHSFQEKIYVHTDKDIYLSTETIWFKVYNVEAYTNISADISKVAYVEVLDKDLTPIVQTKIELHKGKGEGMIYLPVGTKSGNYTLRCYTNWMRNFDSNFFYRKKITIYNTFKEEGNQEKELEKLAVQFFPEGGNLVSGLKNKIAFKAINQYGKGYDFKGYIINSTNDTLVRFEPYKFGMGSFEFIPKITEKYKVFIKPIKGAFFETVLPKVFENGAVMTLNNYNEQIEVAVQSSQNNHLENFTLFVNSGNHIVAIKSLNNLSLKKSITLSKKDLKEGISYFTLLNSENKAICERIFFKAPTNISNISLNIDKDKYKTREKVNLSIYQKTIDSNLVNSDFSVSVYKADSVSSSENITTRLWLTSELKGKIENANWYLNNITDFIALDNLMLTHGWRRFKWEEIFREKEYEYLPEIEGPIITGLLFNKSTNKPVANTNVFLSNTIKTKTAFYTSLSNNKGLFRFYPKYLPFNNEIIIQTQNDLDSNLGIEIKSPYFNESTDTQHNYFSYKNAPKDLLDRSIAVQLKKVFFEKYEYKKIILEQDTIPFYYKADKTYHLKDYTQFTTLEEVFREYIQGVSVGIKNKEYNLRLYDNDLGIFHDKAPLMLIDGVPIFDEGNGLLKLNPTKIKSINMIYSQYVYGNNIFYGIVSLESVDKDLAGYNVLDHTLVLDYNGFQNKREFYAPIYEKNDVKLERQADYRTTLYWQPFGELIKNAELSFFTSDIEGDYFIEIQTLSKEGITGYKYTNFKVEN